MKENVMKKGSEACISVLLTGSSIHSPFYFQVIGLVSCSSLWIESAPTFPNQVNSASSTKLSVFSFFRAYDKQPVQPRRGAKKQGLQATMEPENREEQTGQFGRSKSRKGARQQGQT